ncbi:hypothetical protein Tco_0971394 [Tanacetum coccineum]
MKLTQFLMGLDDSYLQIRSSILSRETLPDVRSAYAIISSEESHRVASGGISSNGFSDEQMATLISLIKENYVNEKGVHSNMADYPLMSEKCVHVGYSNFKKGYKLWSLDNKQIVYSRDVKFFEDIFPFKQNNSIRIDIFVQDVNHLNFFNINTLDDFPDMPNDEDRRRDQQVSVSESASDSSVEWRSEEKILKKMDSLRRQTQVSEALGPQEKTNSSALILSGRAYDRKQVLPYKYQDNNGGIVVSLQEVLKELTSDLLALDYLISEVLFEGRLIKIG